MQYEQILDIISQQQAEIEALRSAVHRLQSRNATSTSSANAYHSALPWLGAKEEGNAGHA